MSENETIDSLRLEINSSAKGAVEGIDALSNSLLKLKSATKGGLGLTSVLNNMKSISSAAGSVDGNSVRNMEGLARAAESLSRLKGVSISPNIAKQITAISGAAKTLQGVNLAPLGELTNGLKSMSAIGKGNIGSFINPLKKVPEAFQALGQVDISAYSPKLMALMEVLKPLEDMPKLNLGSNINQIKKLPEIMKELEKVNIGDFATQMREVADAIRPLATEMEKVSRGFSAFPAKIQKLITSGSRIPTMNRAIGSSYVSLAAKAGVWLYVMRRISRVMAGWINESNKYIENMNLFNVSMGEFAKEARDYAETVGNLMGIDPGEWMRNQGIFQTLTTGFGVAADRAYIMSKNLTQLGYDLSSFFNIATAEAFQKLQSGISGELEPLNLAA